MRDRRFIHSDDSFRTVDAGFRLIAELYVLGVTD
jgi:hypothetical protein